MSFERILTMAPVLLFSIVAHEYAHGEAAYRQGDTTAYMLGRLTLNPLKHIDPFMTVILPVFMILMNFPFVFGAAKPVPVNPRNYRNYRRGEVIVSLAGIATNLALFVIATIAFALVGLLGRAVTPLTGPLVILQQMMFWAMLLNLILAFFNLIPVPPLDGSHVLKLLLPPTASMRYSQLYALGFIPILLVMWLLPGVVNAFMWPVYAMLDVAHSIVFPFILSGGWLSS
ncbi:MAG TPA: site-2 protease family protein [Gemmatimonadales bacterium]|nr:site-2 protease family protein [Gemmatimonadales bacterium]